MLFIGGSPPGQPEGKCSLPGDGRPGRYRRRKGPGDRCLASLRSWAHERVITRPVARPIRVHRPLVSALEDLERCSCGTSLDVGSGGGCGGISSVRADPADREPPPAPRSRLGASARQRRTRPPCRQIRPRGVRGGRARPRPARPRGVDRPHRPVRRRTRRPEHARGSGRGGTRNRRSGRGALPRPGGPHGAHGSRPGGRPAATYTPPEQSARCSPERSNGAIPPPRRDSGILGGLAWISGGPVFL